MHRKNKRGYKVKSSKILGSNVVYMYGGYYYDPDKKRLVRYYSKRAHKDWRTIFARRVRRDAKRNIRKEEFDNIKDKNPNNDFWYYD